MELGDYLTVAETARLLKKHRTTVERWLRGGKLAGKKLGGRWVVPCAVLEAWLSEHAMHQAMKKGGEADLNAARLMVLARAARLWEPEDSIFDTWDAGEDVSV